MAVGGNEMEIIIKFRRPSKRLMWKLRKLDRWIDRNVPPILTFVSGSLLAAGFIVLMGVVGSIEYGDQITHTTIRLLLGAVVSMVVGGVMLGCLGDVEE
jgi:hypothetical protein